jgi:hypothetical protein
MLSLICCGGDVMRSVMNGKGKIGWCRALALAVALAFGLATICWNAVCLRPVGSFLATDSDGCLALRLIAAQANRSYWDHQAQQRARATYDCNRHNVDTSFDACWPAGICEQFYLQDVAFQHYATCRTEWGEVPSSCHGHDKFAIRARYETWSARIRDAPKCDRLIYNDAVHEERPPRQTSSVPPLRNATRQWLEHEMLTCHSLILPELPLCD